MQNKAQSSFYTLDPFNFVPLTRTPWGGEAIAKIKRRAFPEAANKIPERIGESWEVSTDAQFVSAVVDDTLMPVGNLVEALSRQPASMLGKELAARFAGYTPLLLKWLQANDVLSVQVHPNHQNPLLQLQECGKPESWLVLEVEPQGRIYLGFKDGLSEPEILQCLSSGLPQYCLHEYKPKPFDYISVPTGCVHAVGSGVLIAEPQFVLPNRSGKTWRLSDWGRAYNDKGELDKNGKPRELHLEQGRTAIDWSLPRGRKIEELLVHRLVEKTRFVGDAYNPFAVEVFTKKGRHTYQPLCPGQFSLITVWRGQVELTAENGETCLVRCGQSAFIAAAAGALQLSVQPQLVQEESVGCAFFAIRPEAL